MLPVGLTVSISPFRHGWDGDLSLALQLLGGFWSCGLAVLALLRPAAASIAYLNSFIGAAWLGLFVVAGVPGPAWSGPAMMALALMIPASCAMPGPDAPPGWFHNPSAWVQRLPLVICAAVGAGVSRADPVTAAAFLAALAGSLLGDRRRWRSAPWTLALCWSAFTAAAACACARLLGDPSLAAGLGAACAATLLALSFDEICAANLYLRLAPQLGKPFWRAFWAGGDLVEDPSDPPPSRRPAWTPPRPVGRRHGRKARDRARAA